MIYRRFKIEESYNPIGLNWSAAHVDYDGEGDDRAFYGKSESDVINQIDCFYDENPEEAEAMQKLTPEQIRNEVIKLKVMELVSEDFCNAVIDITYRCENAEADLSRLEFTAN